MYLPNLDEFDPFCLKRLLSTCFGESSEPLKPCILIDLPDLPLVKDFQFSKQPNFEVQKNALKHFLLPLNQGIGNSLNFEPCDLFACKATGGSNLDPEDALLDPNGKTCSLMRDVCGNYDLILAISDFSLTAPLTALAKRHGFRGATMHGMNEVILHSGLSVDYREVSAQAELFRSTLDEADYFDFTFRCLQKTYHLRITCSGSAAQKSHGLCPLGTPDVANLPAGEVYFVPTGVEGSFPFRFSDGTLCVMRVEGGAIRECSLLSGSEKNVFLRNKQLNEDPATGIIGELGFGTQLLPVSGKDIQDEKILGTCHIATGRSDHLGGSLTPDLFKSRHNASHDDILYAPFKTPEIEVVSVSMIKGRKEVKILENYFPSDFLLERLTSLYPVEKITSARANLR